jgi:hypothetical protein
VTEKHGPNGMAERDRRVVGGVDLFSALLPASGSRTLPHFGAWNVGRACNSADSVLLGSGPGITTDTQYNPGARLLLSESQFLQ